jgi:hypothetical protein
MNKFITYTKNNISKIDTGKISLPFSRNKKEQKPKRINGIVIKYESILFIEMILCSWNNMMIFV